MMRGLILMAAVMASFTMKPAYADGLGRVFFTPAERKLINKARESYDPTRQEIIVKEGPAPEVAPPPAPLPDLAVNGVVIRSSGRNATWINGAGMLSGEQTGEGIRVEASEDGRTVRFILPGGSDTGPIKPGQMLDPNAGKIKEQFSLLKGSDDD